MAAAQRGRNILAGSCIFIIVDRGKADALLHRAQRLGISRGTILLGEGTMLSGLLDLLGISQTQKELLLMGVNEETAEQLYAMLREEFKLHKRYKGIAFSVPYLQFDPENKAPAVFSRVTGAPYVCLMTVLDHGLGPECMRVARQAGAQGGTILHAHGAGVPQDFTFPLMVEPRKDTVLIVTPQESAAAIRDAVYAGMRLERKGSGILFAMPVTRTLGLYEERQAGKAVEP